MVRSWVGLHRTFLGEWAKAFSFGGGIEPKVNQHTAAQFGDGIEAR